MGKEKVTIDVIAWRKEVIDVEIMYESGKWEQDQALGLRYAAILRKDYEPVGLLLAQSSGQTEVWPLEKGDFLTIFVPFKYRLPHLDVSTLNEATK